MNDPFWTPDRLNVHHDQAHAEAQQLRREALADFWRGVDELLTTPARQARRAGERWLHRLARHERVRQQA